VLYYMCVAINIHAIDFSVLAAGGCSECVLCIKMLFNNKRCQVT